MNISYPDLPLELNLWYNSIMNVNYLDLPDGTILITRNGNHYSKGLPHADVANGVGIPLRAGGLVGWRQDIFDDHIRWQGWDSNGKANHNSNFDIVKYVLSTDAKRAAEKVRVEQNERSMIGYGAIERFIPNMIEAVTKMVRAAQAVNAVQTKPGIKPAVNGLTVQPERTHKFGGHGAAFDV